MKKVFDDNAEILWNTGLGKAGRRAANYGHPFRQFHFRIFLGTSLGQVTFTHPDLKFNQTKDDSNILGAHTLLNVQVKLRHILIALRGELGAFMHPNNGKKAQDRAAMLKVSNYTDRDDAWKDLQELTRKIIDKAIEDDRIPPRAEWRRGVMANRPNTSAASDAAIRALSERVAALEALSGVVPAPDTPKQPGASQLKSELLDIKCQIGNLTERMDTVTRDWIPEIRAELGGHFSFDKET